MGGGGGGGGGGTQKALMVADRLTRAPPEHLSATPNRPGTKRPLPPFPPHMNSINPGTRTVSSPGCALMMKTVAPGARHSTSYGPVRSSCVRPWKASSPILRAGGGPLLSSSSWGMVVVSGCFFLGGGGGLEDGAVSG
jgi:hypothetical protein